MTKHLNETCDYLLKFCLKYYTKYSESCDKEEQTPFVCLQPKKKSSQICKENIGIIMLSNVPGISTHVATQLLEPFDRLAINNVIEQGGKGATNADEVYLKLVERGKTKDLADLFKNLRSFDEYKRSLGQASNKEQELKSQLRKRLFSNAAFTSPSAFSSSSFAFSYDTSNTPIKKFKLSSNTLFISSCVCGILLYQFDSTIF